MDASQLHRRSRDGDAAARTADEGDARRDVIRAEHRAAVTSAAAILHFTEVRAVGQVSVNVCAGIRTHGLEQQFAIRAGVEVVALAHLDCVDIAGAPTSAAAARTCSASAGSGRRIRQDAQCECQDEGHNAGNQYRAD